MRNVETEEAKKTEKGSFKRPNEERENVAERDGWRRRREGLKQILEPSLAGKSPSTIDGAGAATLKSRPPPLLELTKEEEEETKGSYGGRCWSSLFPHTIAAEPEEVMVNQSWREDGSTRFSRVVNCLFEKNLFF